MIHVCGARGIIGQHLRLICPEVRCHVSGDPLPYVQAGDVVIWLRGINSPDECERNPEASQRLNVDAPLAMWQLCSSAGAHMVYVSSQAAVDPVGVYGRHKRTMEGLLGKARGCTVARPTFVLGMRPLPHEGRRNPLEQMLEAPEQRQVCDRWFSVSFAHDVARSLLRLASHQPGGIHNLGLTKRTTRFEIAQHVQSLHPAGNIVWSVRHDDEFPNLAPRPMDTTYEEISDYYSQDIYDVALSREIERWQGFRTMDLRDRAREIALFMGLSEDEALTKLRRGFKLLNAAVRSDWLKANPSTDAEILQWYRTTEAYIWELSAYHTDAGFNYGGTVQGIAKRLADGGFNRVLCLGDGIGGMTIAAKDAGLEPVYHDLAGSRTAAFAGFRYGRRYGQEMISVCTHDFTPEIGGQYDAVVSLDFLEHVPNVPDWVEAIKASLVPGGLFFAQNAFGIGSGVEGALPMHLVCNDRFEKDWDPLLSQRGFSQESSNWYRRAA